MRRCEYCGKPLAGQREAFCSEACRAAAYAADARRANRELGRFRGSHNEPRDKVCVDCGGHYLGYPRSMRCPVCRAEARSKAALECRQRKRAGKVRALGSTDLCEVCGKPYTVAGGLQRMCEDCARERIRARALESYHADKEANLERRRELRAGTVAQAARMREKRCPTCEADFVPDARHRVYCSDACAAARTMARGNAPSEGPHGLEGRPSERYTETENSQRRVAAGLTKERLSELSGVGYRTLWNWEHGQPVSEKTRLAVEKVLREAEEEKNRAEREDGSGDQVQEQGDQAVQD